MLQRKDNAGRGSEKDRTVRTELCRCKPAQIEQENAESAE